MEYEQELWSKPENCLTTASKGSFLSQKARLFYGELEKHYLEKMDFDGIESCRKEVLERIINIVGRKIRGKHAPQICSPCNALA